MDKEDRSINFLLVIIAVMVILSGLGILPSCSTPVDTEIELTPPVRLVTKTDSTLILEDSKGNTRPATLEERSKYGIIFLMEGDIIEDF